MPENRLLIVDDEEGLRDILRQYAQADGFQVQEACDGREALELLGSGSYAAVLLDVMMPGIDGWTVLREIRRQGDLPVLMLTARGEEYDRLFGFELGADDYIVKPFSPREVMARLHAVLRRKTLPVQEEEVIRVGELLISPGAQSVLNQGKEIPLSRKEFDLLLFLAQNVGRVMTREVLLERVWGYDYYGDVRTVDTHIKQLRDRLGEFRGYVVTVWGTGYKLVPEAGQ